MKKITKILLLSFIVIAIGIFVFLKLLNKTQNPLTVSDLNADFVNAKIRVMYTNPSSFGNDATYFATYFYLIESTDEPVTRPTVTQIEEQPNVKDFLITSFSSSSSPMMESANIIGYIDIPNQLINIDKTKKYKLGISIVNDIAVSYTHLTLPTKRIV